MLPNNKFPYVSSQEKRKKVQDIKIQGSEVQDTKVQVQRFKGSGVQRFKVNHTHGDADGSPPRAAKCENSSELGRGSMLTLNL